MRRVFWTLLVMVLACGCQRRTQLMTADTDTTGTAIDSVAISMREAQDSWEVEGRVSDAAEKSLHALVADLRRREPDEWGRRAECLLDSLGIGAETASQPCVLAVNFFPRSDPSRGSWPYVIWCGAKGIRHQELDGRDLRLHQMVMKRSDTGEAKESERSVGSVAILFSRQRGPRQEPMVMVFEAPDKKGRLNLMQALGPDSLGGAGTGEFEMPSDTTIDLVTRTFRTPRGFDECTTCPHVYHIHRFHWGPRGFARIEDRRVPTPYSTFVGFIEMLTTDPTGASALVTDMSLVENALQWDWAQPRGRWRVIPTADESAERLVFFRGAQEAYRVQFEPRDDGWVISAIELIPRSVE